MTADRDESLAIISKGLAEFFKDEPEKIAIWLFTDNPFFGNISPSALIVLRGDKGLEKVANFVKSREIL